MTHFENQSWMGQKEELEDNDIYNTVVKHPDKSDKVLLTVTKQKHL